MNHLCENCKYKYEPIDIFDYYKKTGTIPNMDWSFLELRSTFWLCSNSNNSPIDFSSKVVKYNKCDDFNTFGTCPFYMQSNAENIKSKQFEIKPIEEEIFVDDEVSLKATPVLSLTTGNEPAQILNFKYQWYKDGRKLFREKKDTITIPTKAPYTAYYHCVVTETMSDNGDGGMKVAEVKTNSVEVIVKEKIEPLP